MILTLNSDFLTAFLSGDGPKYSSDEDEEEEKEEEEKKDESTKEAEISVVVGKDVQMENLIVSKDVQ